MVTKCPLLKSERNGQVCFGGVNFFTVGEDCAFCQRCDLRDMIAQNAVPDCAHLDIYTYLNYETGLIQPIFTCDRAIGEPHDPQRATCSVCVFSVETVAAD